ncbi:hypothetical protein SRHO_G00328670 [Serrasalmus rhombeus]
MLQLECLKPREGRTYPQRSARASSSVLRCQKSTSSKRNPERTAMVDNQIRTLCRVIALLSWVNPAMPLQKRRSLGNRPCSARCSPASENELSFGFKFIYPSNVFILCLHDPIRLNPARKQNHLSR